MNEILLWIVFIVKREIHSTKRKEDFDHEEKSNSNHHGSAPASHSGKTAMPLRIGWMSNIWTILTP